MRRPSLVLCVVADQLLVASNISFNENAFMSGKVCYTYCTCIAASLTLCPIVWRTSTLPVSFAHTVDIAINSPVIWHFSRAVNHLCLLAILFVVAAGRLKNSHRESHGHIQSQTIERTCLCHRCTVCFSDSSHTCFSIFFQFHLCNDHKPGQDTLTVWLTLPWRWMFRLSAVQDRIVSWMIEKDISSFVLLVN